MDSSAEPLPRHDRHIDALVSMLADVIRHAGSLQTEAQDTLTQVKASAMASREATAAVARSASSLEERLVDKVATAIASPFDKAVGNAARTIAEDLMDAKAQARHAISNLTDASAAAVNAIHDQAGQVEQRVLYYLLIGAVFGMPIGVLMGWLFARFGLLPL